MSIVNIAAVLYALQTLNHVWLAFNRLEYIPLFYYFTQAVGYLCVIFGMLVILVSQRIRVQKTYIALLIIPFTYYFMCIFHNYGRIEAVYEELRRLIPISMLVLFNKKLKIKIFNLTYWITQALNVLSLFMWTCYVFNINIGFERVLYYTAKSWGQGTYYIKWGIFAIWNSVSFSRLCGVFNEPGGLGTLCALLFIARYSRSKFWEKAVLILTGIFTFSLAFYFMIFIYAALCLIKKDKRYIFLIVVLGILFVNIPDIDWGNPMLNNLAERMKITDSGVAGNNRVDNKADERLMTDGKYLFGYGYGVDISHVLSYKQLVLQFGYVGFLFMLFEWLYFALKHNNYRGGGGMDIF